MTKSVEGRPKKTGRPRKEVDFATIDKLCSLHCTADEIVAYMNLQDSNISHDTIARRIKEEYKMTFAEYIDQKHKATAKPSLRRMQWKAAEAGNTSMLIWLGKQYLGQKDKQEMEHSGELAVKVRWK